MRSRLTKSFGFFIIGAILVSSPGAAAAQVPPDSQTLAARPAASPTLLEQLEAQYQPTHLGGHGPQRTIIDPGTVLVVQKGGILGVNPDSLGYCTAKYQKGVLHPPNSICASMAQTGRNFEVGEKVYVTKIEVNLKEEKVVFKVADCDSCNGVNPPSFYKSQVDFIFPSGYLQKGDVGGVEDTIGEVFALDAIPAPPPGVPLSPAAEPPPPTQPAAPAAAPATIQLGQTTDQVIAILGQPEKKVELGAKEIYIYKDLKVTFVNGKVASAE